MDQKNEQHELITALKELALELGRTPTRDEFDKRHGHRLAVSRNFGGWAPFVQAAGLEPIKVGARKIDNSIWNRDIEQHLEEYVPRPSAPPEPYKRTLFIPDVHFPFASQRTLEKIYRFAEAEKPEVVVQVGDLYDRYSHARFPRSLNVFTPDQEDAISRRQAETMWAEIKKTAPNAECFQCLGNHDLRPLKQILASYPQMERWAEKMIAESMTFEGVKTILDPREALKLPGSVDVIHGYLSRLGDHRNYTLTNVVHGHTHKGGVVFRQIHGRVLWEMDVGLAGDPEAKGLSYTPQKTTAWTLGFGFLDSYGPRFISA